MPYNSTPVIEFIAGFRQMADARADAARPADLADTIDRMRTLVSRINRRITTLERRHASLDKMVDVMRERDHRRRRIAQ
jgi:hypothetical protein